MQLTTYRRLKNMNQVLALCFAHVSRYNADKFKGAWLNYMQLEIPCLTNGGI